MGTILGKLKEIREQKELSVEDIADTLRISKEYIVAIEESDYLALPEKVYAIGFIKNYAKFLGANADGAVSEYRTEFIKERPPALAKESVKVNSTENDLSEIFRNYREKLELILRPHKRKISYLILTVAVIALVIYIMC